MGGIETSVTCHCKAKGTREVQTRKAVLVSPACHLLFRYQHLVASLFSAVTPTHQMNAQAETSWMGKPARRSCLLALKKRSGDSSPPPHRKPSRRRQPYSSTVLSGCLSPHPKTSSICWPQEKGMPHPATTSEHTRQRSHLPLNIRQMGARLHTDGTLFSVLMW